MLDFNPGEHICVVGDARPEKTNPIYLAHEKVILILVVERATGLIVDADTNMVCELTRRFLRSVFVGHSLVDDLEADSLDAVELNLALNDVLGFSLTDEELKSIVTAGAVRRRPVRPDEVPGQHQSGA